MIDRKNLVVDANAVYGDGNYSKIQYIKALAQLKFVDYLRLTANKNQFNRLSTYHYLNVAVTNSTEPVAGLDYISNEVTSAVDYSTAVGCKCLMTDGRLKFEFQKFNEDDEKASVQATKLVDYFMNDANNSFQVLQNWIQDANINKNGTILVLPISKETTFYREVTGTMDELRAFEIKVSEQGLKVKKVSRKKIDVDLMAAMQNIQAAIQNPQQEEMAEGNPPEEAESIQDEIIEEMDKATIYKVKYKLTGSDFKIEYRHIKQHYFVCNPTIQTIERQDFIGFYDIMSVHDACRLYPFVDPEAIQEHAKYGPNDSFQAGSLENDLAIHVRDSTPVQGQSTVASGTTDPMSRQITMTTAWIRMDYDNDGQEELIEICFSGDYVTYIKEVEFIPLANICPRPLNGNYYGFSTAERCTSYHEYMTSLARCELAFALQASSPKIGVNPEFLDADEFQNGKASLFILDSRFDPTKHIWQQEPMQGNLQYLQSSFERMQNNKAQMIGMTQSSDVLNPEVMAPGNAAAKLQLALGPNQLTQDNYIHNLAIGVKDLLYLTWRTVVQYASDWGVIRLLEKVTPQDEWQLDEKTGNKAPIFYDAIAFENFEALDRQMIDIDLALGMASEENRIINQQVIMQNQQSHMSMLAQLGMTMPLTPEIYDKMTRPYKDTLTVLGVKDPMKFLVSFEEAMEAQKMAEQARQNQPPDPKAMLDLAKVEETKAKTDKIQAEVQGTGFPQKLAMVQMLKEPDNVKSVSIE